MRYEVVEAYCDNNHNLEPGMILHDGDTSPHVMAELQRNGIIIPEFVSGEAPEVYILGDDPGEPDDIDEPEIET